MKPVATPLRRWEIVGLVSLLLLAAGLRLIVPGISEFKRDEANLSQLALDLAHGRDLPLLGIRSSVDIPNPPISVYLFAIPYALSGSPIPATLFVGLLSVAAVGLAWGLARRYYGSLAALAAGLLYAASPWAVIYSRKIWAQDLLPPFVVATVFTGLLGYGEDKRWARWSHWPLLALTVQIHFGAFTLIPLSLLMLALWDRRPAWRDTLIGLGLAALSLIPVLVGAARDDLLSLDTLRTSLDSNSAHQRQIGSEALDYAWFTVAGTNIHALAGPEQFENYLDSVPDVYPLFKLVPLAAVLAAGGLSWRVLTHRQARRSPDAILIAWLLLPVIAFTWQWTEVAPHYMIPLMPAAYLLCGAGLAALYQTVRTPHIRWIVAAGGIGLIVVIAALQTWLFAGLLRFVDDHDTPGGFGTPLHYLLDVRDAVLSRQPEDVIVISNEEIAPYDEEPAVWSVLLDPVPSVRFVDGTQTVVIPARPALELIAWSPDLIACDGQDCAAGSPGVEVFDLRPGSDECYILWVSGGGARSESLTPIEPVRFANGAVLIAYAVREEGLWLAWELDGPVSADYHAFVHALDAQGQKLDQRDRLAWPGAYWRAGDTLLLWFDLVLPPGTATLYTGMYTTDGSRFQNVEVLDAQGAYLVQGAAIPLSD